VNDLKSSLRAHLVRNPQQRTSALVDAAVLSAALRQLGPLTETSVTEPRLDGVLVEVQSGAVGIITTDRYVLLARMNVPAIVDGPPARVRLSTSAVLAWLRERRQVELIVEIPVGRDDQRRQSRAWFHDAQGEEFMLPQEPDRFPDVRQIIDAIELTRGRVLFARDDVLRLVAERDAPMYLACVERLGHLTTGDRVVSGQGIGTFPSLELSSSAVRRIAKAAVGDELTCDVSEPGQPLVWRAPSQPDFMALMMPRAA
jgi:DNA polymerase-3 subunit beta